MEFTRRAPEQRGSQMHASAVHLRWMASSRADGMRLLFFNAPSFTGLGEKKRSSPVALPLSRGVTLQAAGTCVTGAGDGDLLLG